MGKSGMFVWGEGSCSGDTSLSLGHRYDSELICYDLHIVILCFSDCSLQLEPINKHFFPLT